MSEQLSTPEVEPTITPTAQSAQPTQPQAVNVDLNAIAQLAEQKAEQKMQAVFKSMLTQQGLDPETVNKMTEEWKAKQSTPEQELQKRDETIGTLQQQLENERQEKLALAKGIPLGADDEPTKEKVNACLTLAKSYTSDAVPFDVALDKAIAIIGFEKKPEAPPPFYDGAGKAPITPPEVEAMRAEYQAAAKNRDNAKMSFLTRKAKEKKIELF